MVSERHPVPFSSSDSATACSFPLANEPDAEQFIEDLLPGVHESGQPFVDWFLGGPVHARSVLRDWMSRSSSEVYVGRATVRTRQGAPVGGIITLNGAELANCRVADAMAAAKLAGPGGSTAVASRLKGAQTLFPEVPANHLYISRLWVSREARGEGHGLVLVREALAAGRRNGFSRFSADICGTNQGVMKLVQFFKFQFVKQCYSEEAGMTYTSWILIDAD